MSTALDVQRTSCIDSQVLLPGDIIVTASDSLNSKGIRWATNAAFSHALIYRGSGLVVEATPGEGVATKQLQGVLTNVDVAVVFRHLTASRHKREMAAKWASAQASKPYNYIGAVRIGLEPGARTASWRYTRAGMAIQVIHSSGAARAEDGHDTTFFCSELVLRAYEEVGFPLVSTQADLVGPDHLQYSRQLELMGSLKGGLKCD